MQQYLKLVACQAVASIVGVPALAQVDFGRTAYEKLATRAATEQRMIRELQQLPDITWGDWYLLSSFDGNEKGTLGRILPPEMELPKMTAGGEGPDLSKTYAGKSGMEAKWVNFGSANDTRLDLKVHKDQRLNNRSTCYLYRTITAKEATSLKVTMGSDDGLRVWVNARLVVDADVPRGLDPEDHKLTLDLQPGVNHFLAKVTQGQGGWDFQMNTRRPLDSITDAKLLYQLNRDFPTAEMSHYAVATIPVPDDVSLEVGGLDVLADGRAVVCTRRGDVYIVSGITTDAPFSPRYTLFASGLHEPLGVAVAPAELSKGWKKGDGVSAVYCVQRSELTRLVDTNRDDHADVYETVCNEWGVSGNYHEFAFGPKIDAEGNCWVTLNVGFCDALGKSIVPYRGWALKVAPDGTMTPIAGGLRSPNGIGIVPIKAGVLSGGTETAIMYADNQGDFVGTNRIMVLGPGVWAGHPSGLRWRGDWKQGDPPPERQRAAMWFPYPKMGQSTADIVVDDTQGRFGPFAGQVFVGDQTLATVMRASFERVSDGAGKSFIQGACFPFFKGLDCGVNRLAFDQTGAMLIGETDRGWGSVGRRRFGLQRLQYTGVEPFEILTMHAAPDGFVLTFTQDVDKASAENPASYRMSSYTYEYHQKYGSDEMEARTLAVSSATMLGPRTVHLLIDGIRGGGEGYVHELHADGVKNAAGSNLLHAEAYYTMQVIPGSMPSVASR
ncbi:MAG: hypothetical protein AB7G11_15460 [Phycisphaerales bacterium]